MTARTTLKTFAALILVATQVSASDVVVTGLTPGKTVYLRVTVSGSGVASVSQIPSVTVGTTPTNPDIPTDPPVDPGLSGLSKIAFDAAVSINKPTEAATLAATYSAIASELRNGNLRAVDAAERTTEAVDTVLGVMRAQSRWAPWREAMGAAMRAANIRTSDDLATAYEGLAGGLTAAANGSNAAVDFAVIVKLVLAIITKNPAAIAEAVLALVQSLRS